MRLHDIAHSRAGDKGDISDLSLIAYDPDDYGFLVEYVTVERVRQHFSDIVRGDVIRYEVPDLYALKFVLHGALGGGVTRTLNQDIHGKSLSSSLLELEVPDRSPNEEVPPRVRVHAPAGIYEGLLGQDGAAVFAGIPFAAPPTGRLRFRPPQPLPDSTGVIDATRFRAAPAQVGTALQVASAEAPEAPEGPADPASALSAMLAAAPVVESSEDCLHLNVWSPNVQGDLPVIVWIYGGGFDTGSASPPVTDGAALSRLTDTVVVAVNYRVGALGFGYWRGVGGEDWADSSNLGLQDQIAGLAWARRNIGAFGGDASNITVAGESAGGFSIGALLAIPSARQSFDKAILHSGSTRRIFPTSTSDSLARDLMTRVGAESMEELQDVDMNVILAAQSQVIDSDIGLRNLAGGRSWGVTLDGELLTQYPLEAVAAGAARDIPLLVGANRDETLPFARMVGAGWEPSDEAALVVEIGNTDAADPKAVLAAYRATAGDGAALGDLRTAFLSDAIYRRPAVETAVAQRSAGGPAWCYLFSAEPFGPTIGAGHGLDLLYMFDVLPALGQATETNLAVQKDFALAWANFAYTGAPGWPEYDYDKPVATRQFGGAAAFVSEPPFGPVRDVWPLSAVAYGQD